LGLLTFRRGRDGACFCAGQGRRSVVWLGDKKRSRAQKTGPSLRVARQIVPGGVARLAWRNLTQQRGSLRNVNRP